MFYIPTYQLLTYYLLTYYLLTYYLLTFYILTNYLLTYNLLTDYLHSVTFYLLIYYLLTYYLLTFCYVFHTYPLFTNLFLTYLRSTLNWTDLPSTDPRVTTKKFCSTEPSSCLNKQEEEQPSEMIWKLSPTPSASTARSIGRSDGA